MTSPKLGFCFENFEVTFMVCQPFRYICYFYISSVLVIMINEIWTYVLICFSQKCLHLARIPKQYHLSSTWLPQALVTCSRQEFNPRGVCTIWNTHGLFSSPWGCPAPSLVSPMHILDFILFYTIYIFAESRALVTQDRNEIVYLIFGFVFTLEYICRSFHNCYR